MIAANTARPRNRCRANRYATGEPHATPSSVAMVAVIAVRTNAARNSMSRANAPPTPFHPARTSVMTGTPRNRTSIVPSVTLNAPLANEARGL